MKVALLGAPGAGKTRVANALKREIECGVPGPDFQSWAVVDKYVTKLRKRTGLPYDWRADFPQNVAVMAERWSAEAQARKNYESTITCGTIYDTLAYTLAISFPQPQNEAEMLAQTEYLNVCYRFLGAMEDTTADYDLLFYLPYKEPVTDTWHGIVDLQIPRVLEGEFRRAYTLTGSTKERVNAAVEKIQEVQAVQSASKAANAE